MPIEVDFGTELGTVVFPEDYTQEQAFDFVKQNRKQIQQNLIQRRQQEMADETSQLEAAKYRAGDYGTLETIGGVVSELPKAITEGFGGAMKGAERLSGMVPARQFNPFTGQIGAQIQPSFQPGQGDLAKAGQAVQEFGRETFPSLPGVQESIPAQIAGGVGSTLSVLPGALLAGPVGAGALYGLSAGEAGAEDARRVINRRIAERLAAGDSQGAEDLQAQASQLESQAFLLNAAIGGVSEGVLGVAGKIRFGKSNIGGVGARLAERMIPKAASLRTQNMIRGGVEGVVTEGLQESLEQSMGNMAAKVTYEPERGIMDGVAQAGFIGAATGGLVGGAIGSKRNPNLAKANAIAEATGADPANPLPRSTATVSGLQDGTQSMGPIDIEPEITPEDVMRMSQEAGIPMPAEEVAPVPAPVVAPVPAPQAVVTPSPAPAPVTPAPAAAPVTPAAATVDAETGLRSDEQDELDQLITAEDAGLLSEDDALTLAAYRARLGGVNAVVTPVAPTPTPVATPVVRTPASTPTPAPVVTTSAKLPEDLAEAKPRYSFSLDTYVPAFDSDFDLAAYIVTQAKPSLRDADYLNWAVEASGMTPEEVRKHGLQVRAQIKQLSRQTKGGTSQKPATLVVPSVRITMPEVKVAATPVSVPVAAPVTPAPTPVAPTPTPAPEYTPARINKLFQSLKARATAVGKGLYEIKKLAPGQRLVLRTSSGRLQETDQFLLREKSEVTGNVYDEGFILRDKQEYAAGQAPKPAPTPAPVTPAPVAPTPAPATSSDVLDQMTLWRRKKPSPLKRAYGLNPTPEQAASHKKQVAAWEKEYRRLGKLYKTLEQEKAQRAAKVRPASPGEQVQPPAAAGAPMQEGIDNIKFVSEPVAQARGGGMDAKDAKAKLVQQLERAVAAAPAESDQQYRDLISTGQTDLEERFKTVNDKNMGAGFEAKYRKAHELGKQLLAKYGSSVPKVTIEIPGDGTYTIANTKQALNQVLAKAQKLNTSTAKGPVRAPAAARKPERANEMLMRMAKQATQVYGKNAAAKLREQAKNRDLDLTDEQRNDLKVVADMITPVTAEPVAAEPTEAELQAAEEARLAQAEQEIDAGPIGQAKQKLEDEGSDMKKSQVKAMARKLEKAGVIDDSELDDEGRDTEVDELVGQLLERIEEARDTAIQEREQELADEAKAEKAAPKTAAQSAIDAIDKVSKGLSENSYSDPLFLTPLAKLALQIAKGLIQVGVAVDKAIRQAIAQARQQFPNDPTDDIQLADRLIRDAEYAAAVAAGDMDTAQRMVDEAAVKAGYKTKGFHRTPKAFTKFIPGGPKAEAQFWTTKAGEFRTLFGQSGRAIWFGSSPENLPAYHNDSTGSGVVLEVYLKNPSPLQIDDDTRAWGRDIYADGSKQFPLLLSDEHIQSIRKDGYTGIEYWNNGKTADKSAPDEMVVFDSTQIKSADPVTRDDEGNVVPLSQRFQSSTADIRGESGAYRGIGKRLSDWAKNDTDEATRQVRFTNPSTGEQATFGDVISDLQSISDEAAPEYVRWLQSIPNKSTATADIVSDITWISRLETEAERNQRPDRVEAILKKVIAATDPKGKVFEAIAGLSNFVVFQATKIALRIYQATKSWVAARNAGMDYIKSHVQLSNEAETAANFEEHIKAFPNQEIPAGTPERPQPPSPDVRVPSRGLFLGDISTDTDENWASEAKKWVDFFKGNLERAFQVALTADIDNALKEYILGEIIQRNQLDIARAKGDVEVMRALNLEKRLADSAKSLGAVTAKAMAARKLAQERFWWAQPAMILRNLIRKRQDELIPFSKIESEQVRKWLSESGREAVNQIREAMKKADAVFAREFRKIKQVPGEADGPPIEIKWQDILTQALDTQGSVRQKMLQIILADPRLRNLSPAGIAEITNLLTKAWETKRNQIFRAEFQKKVPLPNVKPDVREKLFRSLPRILKYANIARATPGSFSIQDGPDTYLLWEQAFRDAVAPEFGVAELNGITARKITDLAQKAQAQSGVNRNEIIQQMFRLMAREGGVRFSDVLRDYWYAAVLSGIRTQVDNAMNVFNGFLNTAMFATMAKKDAGFIAYSALKGLDEGIRDFWPMLWRGELYRSVNFNPDQPGSALEGLGESRNLFAKGISQFKYVGRLINALDHMTALMSDSSAKAYALRKLYDADVARQYLTPSPEVVAVARARAIAEGTRPELVNKRTREIIQEKLPVDVLMTSREIREMTTFTETPQGLLGSLYRGLDQAAQGKTLYKVLSGTNFLRFAANSANEILNFALPVALYRWYQSAPGKSEGEYGLKFSESRRDLILAKATFGTVLGIFAGALFLGDDDKEEDRNMDITGSFKSLDPNKRKQLLSEGRQPYSIRFGNTYVSYRQMGFGGVLATIGELRDRQLFSPDKWSQENIIDKVLDGAAAGMFIVKDSTAISGLTELLGFANAYKYDTDEFIEKSFPRYVSRLAGSLVPNILKEVDAWSDPSIFKTEAGNLGYEYFLQQVPFGRREIGPGPILNVLGEPVKVERYPWSRWAKEREVDPAWSTLGSLASKGVFMPTPAITVKVNENGTRRELTREEKYQYQQAVGQGYRKFIEQNRERLLALPPAQASDLIDKNADRIRRNARTNLKNSF